MDKKLKDQILAIPNTPGVYIMKDSCGQILYVGKSKCLKKRIGSYFSSAGANERLDPVKQHMIRNVAKIETLVTKTELDALTWEDKLIKEIQPKYNVKQKDDSSYPYIVLTTHEKFPKLLSRRLSPSEHAASATPELKTINGDLYYGPLTPAKKLYSILRILRKLYKLIPREGNCLNEKRTCIYYDIGICPAPCVGLIDEKSYQKQIAAIKRFLKGGNRMRKMANEKMRFASSRMMYEDAWFWKSVISDIDSFFQRDKDETYAAVDISSISGSFPVAGIIFYRSGSFVKSEYRKISLHSSDDIGAMREAAERYFELIKNGKSKLPKFVVLDGGINHLSSIKKIKNDMGINTTLIAISKEHQLKKTFNGKIVSRVIRRKSDAADHILTENESDTYDTLEFYQLIQKLRDESHRFAVSYHRKKRSNQSFASELDGINGIGTVLKMKLLSKFGSVEKIKEADISKLSSIKGISKKLALNITEQINNL